MISKPERKCDYKIGRIPCWDIKENNKTYLLAEISLKDGRAISYIEEKSELTDTRKAEIVYVLLEGFINEYVAKNN